MCIDKLRETTTDTITSSSSQPSQTEKQQSSTQDNNDTNSADKSSAQTQETLKPVVTNYNSLYDIVEGEAWAEIPDDIKIEVMGEIKKVLEKILVKI